MNVVDTPRTCRALRSRILRLAGASVLSVLLAATVTGTAVAAEVTGLETEARHDPIGIDTATPRLSWRMRSDERGAAQTAYEVVVATTAARARAGQGDLWRSGRVRSRLPHADYDGKALGSRSRAFWTVRIWDQDGDVTAFAPPRSFETAFLDEREWSADWIGGPRFVPPAACSEDGASLRDCTAPSPLLRRSFTVAEPVASARLYASGLGYGTYYVSGKRVGDAVLSPGFTEYTERASYITEDVTDLLRPGHNAIGAVLGRGPFGQVGANFTGYQSAPWHGEPRLRLELHIEHRDGSTQVVRSGPGWRTTDGPIRFDDYMLGETYDARRAAELGGWAEPGFDDRAWSPAPAAAAPAGRLVADVGPPVRPQGDLLPFASVKQLDDGDWLFDLGRNVAGNVVLDAVLEQGQQLTLHYGEKLKAGHVDVSGGSSGGADLFQVDEYTAVAGRNVWRPEFTYKGFQYVEVSGLRSAPAPSMLKAETWNSDLPSTGTWRSSDRLLNEIVAASRRSILSNSVSVPTDTPIYEKTGYTGDGQLISGAASYLFDTRRFFDKWTSDIQDSVAPNGDMPIVAPAPVDPPDPDVGPLGFRGASPGWDVALFNVPEAVRLFGGDERPQRRALPDMRKVLEHYERQATGGLLVGHCAVPALSQPCINGLGDWTHPGPAVFCAVFDASTCDVNEFTTLSTPGVTVDSNAWWAEMLRIAGETSSLAGDAAGARSVRARREALVARFNQAFASPVDGTYRDPLTPPGLYSQHENAMPLGLGLVPPARRKAVGDALAADAAGRGHHLTTGIMGTRFLFEALTRTGHVDEALAIATQTTYPSYGWWFAKGFTALGESWDSSTRSRNHQMYGSIVQWLFADLAGLAPAAPGFAEIRFEPHIPADGLDEVQASIETVRGPAAAHWQREGDTITYEVTVPPNATGRVALPAASAQAVTEGGRPLSEAPGITGSSVEGERLVVRVGAGTYRFGLGR